MRHASPFFRPTLIWAALFLGAGIALQVFPSAAESSRSIPPPALDEPANPTATSEVAVLAGGCFWGVQGVFQHVDGVTSAVSGYAGGAANTAHYEMVGTNTTGMRNRSRSPLIPAGSAMAISCRSISQSRMIRPSSTGRAPTSGRSTVRQSFRPTASRRRSPKPISPSSTRRMYLMFRS
jgi:hypothetical protein